MKPPPTAASIVSGALNLLHLRIALLCAGNDDVRDHLNGVQIEVHPGESPALLAIATDGSRLVVCRQLGAVTQLAAPSRFHLKRDQVKKILAASKPRGGRYFRSTRTKTQWRSPAPTICASPFPRTSARRTASPLGARSWPA